MIDEHEQMVEVRIGHCGEPNEVTHERPICRYCWHESPSGAVIRSDWPCEVVRLREALAYYADIRFYCCRPWAEEHNGMPESESDMGHRARQALGLPEPDWRTPAATGGTGE
jgi:hypothetical protein